MIFKLFFTFIYFIYVYQYFFLGGNFFKSLKKIYHEKFQRITNLAKKSSIHFKNLSVYKKLSKDELFGLISQMRRSSASIPTNIAEGCGRNTNPDFKRFLVIASGSSAELEYQLILSKDLEYITEPAFNELEKELIEIRKMIHSFINKLPDN